MRFENDVKMYGTQAFTKLDITHWMFENDVKMYGTQAPVSADNLDIEFENDVKMYGTQACCFHFQSSIGLRMM